MDPIPTEEIAATEELVDVPPEQKIRRGQKTYTPEVLAKKKELAKAALAKANEARVAKQKEAKLAKVAIEEARKAKEAAKLAEEARKAFPEIMPEAVSRGVPRGEAPASAPPVEKPVRKQPKGKTKVYVDSSESDSGSDDDFVLVRKKLVKRYREIKRQPAASTHEISEEALLRRWQQDRYRLLQDALTGQW